MTVGMCTKMSRNWGFLLLTVLFSSQSWAQGEGPDAEMVSGDRFRGRIAFADDQDRVEFSCLPGARLSVRARRIGKSGLRPGIELLRDGVPFEPSGSLVRVVRKGSRWRLRRLPVPDGGLFEVRISTLTSPGEYLLAVDEQLPGTVRQKVQLVPGETDATLFPARAGATARVRVSGLGRKGAPLQDPLLRAPSGAAISLDGLLTVSHKGRRIEFGPLLLTEDGVYRVELGTAAVDRVSVRVSLAHPSPEGVTHWEEPGSADLSGAIDLGDGFWLPSGGSEDLSNDEVLVQLDGSAEIGPLADRLGCEVEARAPGGWFRLRRRGQVAFGPARSPRAMAATRSLIRTAGKLPRVLRAEPNRLRGSFSIPDDPLYPAQWDMVLAGFEQAWALETGNVSGRIAVLDTGVRAEHPDLAARLTAGFDFVGDAWNAGDGNGYDADPTDMFVSMGTHGTHVAGTVAASTGNGIGVAGGTSGGLVMPVRVLGILGGTDFDIAQGILYAAGLPNAAGALPSQPAEVINMSLGGPTYSAILHQAVRDAVAAGVTVVAASGNSNSTRPMYPAAYPEVIAVGATDLVDERAYYSSYGEHIDLTAPGGDKTADRDQDGEPDGIVSTVVELAAGATYRQKTGTSMSAPHVAAAAFLIRSLAPTTTPEEVRAYLAAGAVDLGPVGKDEEYGHGRLDAGASVRLAAGTGVGPAQLFPSRSRLAIASGQEVTSLALVNAGGGGPISVLDVSSDRFWIQPVQTTGQTPMTIEVRAQTAGLAAGEYDSTLTVESSEGPISVAVHLSVGEGGPVGIQTVFVLAIDMLTDEVAAIEPVTEETAELFQINGLPEGTYRLVATTDLDYDGVLGEAHDYAGEAMDPDSGLPGVVMRNGAVVGDLDIVLEEGAAGNLPGGGGFSW